jgi:DNA end-binding protein Ku
MRSIWKGHIRFSLVTIPIRVYNAIDSAQTIRFNQLHKDCNGRVGYDKRCKKCSQILSGDEIQKGYQYEPDQYVVMQSDDLQAVKLKSTKIIDIEGFVDASEVHPTLFEAPYFAGPDSPVAAKTYALLCQALRKSGKVGVGKVVLRDREDPVILSPQDGGLVLYRLRYPEEVRKMKDVPQLDAKQKIDKEELKLAQQLVNSMSTELRKIDLRDHYHKALKDIIHAKVQGQEIVSYVPEEDKPSVDIMTALKESIEAAKGRRKGMVKATGTKKAAKTKTKKAATTKAQAKKTTAKKATTKKRKSA